MRPALCPICMRPKMKSPGGCLWKAHRVPCRPAPVPPDALVHFLAACSLADVTVGEARMREAVAHCAPLPIPTCVEYLRAQFRGAS